VETVRVEELLKFRGWLGTINLSNWPEDEDEQIEWLEARDESAFESHWLRVHREVQAREQETPLSPDEEAVLTDIRKIAYMTTIRSSGNNELAAYVSDDFGLLARAARLQLEDEWLQKLRAEYEAGRSPHQTI